LSSNALLGVTNLALESIASFEVTSPREMFATTATTEAMTVIAITSDIHDLMPAERLSTRYATWTTPGAQIATSITGTQVALVQDFAT
jgi:hypothetical protein